MKKLLLLILLFPLLCSCSLYYRAIHKSIEGRMGHSSHCLVYSEKDSAIIRDIFNYGIRIGINENDSALSIGAGSGCREFVLSMFTDYVTFYLEDIDTSCITTKRTIEIYLPHYESLRGKPITNKFITTGGTERTLNIGNSKVNKVIIFNVYHHFTDDMAVMSECYRVLVSGGQMIISEHVLKRNRKSYKFCDYGGTYKSEENFIRDVEAAGFRLDTVIRIGKYYRDFFFSK